LLAFEHIGDFYECIGGDAPKAAKLLDITYTTLPNGQWICGFPVFHAERMWLKLKLKGIDYCIEKER
jgi:DNA mismatch repair ATPase MutS